jgi:hypothetical protein
VKKFLQCFGDVALSSVVSVFCTGKNRVVNIVHSSSEMVLRTIKHTMIDAGLGPYVQWFGIKDE